jgi:hypothetical protein
MSCNTEWVVPQLIEASEIVAAHIRPKPPDAVRGGPEPGTFARKRNRGRVNDREIDVAGREQRPRHPRSPCADVENRGCTGQVQAVDQPERRL